MKKKGLIVVIALAVVLLATPYVGVAYAKPSTTVSGTIAVVSGELLKNIPLKYGYQIGILALTEQWMGSIDGLGSTSKSIWLWHNFGSADFTLNIVERLTFQTVTVQGKSGSFVMDIIIEQNSVGGSGYWVISGSTGELANLHGHGTLSLNTFPYTYTGQVYF